MNLLDDPTLFDREWEPPPGEHNPETIARLHKLRERYFAALPAFMAAWSEGDARRRRQQYQTALAGAVSGWPVEYEPEWRD